MQKKEINTGILILKIIPKLFMKRERAPKDINPKKNNGATSLWRTKIFKIPSLLTSLIKLYIKTINNKYHGIFSINAKSCLV